MNKSAFVALNSKITFCRLSLPSGRLTAIKKKTLQDFAQILLCRTSLNRIHYAQSLATLLLF
jgi:hypothetical protein